MPRAIALRRLALAGLVAGFAAALAGCSGGIERSEYTSPVAATSAPAPEPVVPVSTGAAPSRSGRQPLLPPVPEEQSGLPPVTVAQLLPPVVK